jgi:DNA-binding FadR family transcriptional regulator
MRNIGLSNMPRRPVEKTLEGPAKTLPDRIADELIARIFTGELAPNERLPPERALAEELGVDRTSLRVALRQLSRMNVVRATQGSGITVLDYRRHAGLDFLAAVLEIPGLKPGGAFLLEALDQWNHTMPRFVGAALARATPAQLGEIDAILEAQLQVLDAATKSKQAAALDRVAELEMQLQDHMVDLLGDVMLRLAANSTRGIRHELSRLQLELVDARAQCQTQRTMLQRALTSTLAPELLQQAHGAYLNANHEALRAHIATLPPRPHRTTSWTRDVT